MDLFENKTKLFSTIKGVTNRDQVQVKIRSKIQKSSQQISQIKRLHIKHGPIAAT